MKRYNIVIVGIGYVGMGVGVMLSTRHNVTMVDVVKDKVDGINKRVSPIREPLIDEYLKRDDLTLSATTNGKEIYTNADFIIIAVPTNYDEDRKFFDTHIIEDVIQEVLSVNKSIPIIIKSTIPVGYTRGINTKFNADILFSPEFLREGNAL